MAMNAAALKAAMLADLQANLKPLFDAVTNTSDISAMSFDNIWGIITNAIATTVVAHITGNAVATGTDSHGDSHALNIT